MGLFGKKVKTLPREIPQQTQSELSKALEFLGCESATFVSEDDEKAFVLAYKALNGHDDVLLHAFDTEDAIQEHDNSTFRLCRAIIYQNIMLMRKIDYLQKTVEELGEKH